MNEYSMMTQELQDLAALSMEHGQIPSGLYDQYHVLRGLRDVNGKGVLAGLTDISTITSSRDLAMKKWPICLFLDVCHRSRNYRNSRIFLEVIVHCRRTLCETLL